LTIEELENFKGLGSEVLAIQNEIDSLYSPVCCPNGQTGGGHSSTPSIELSHHTGRVYKFIFKEEGEG
jgi:hypothetical protein